MTRLIDADAYLKKVCTYNKTGCGSCIFQTKCPADEPTIDAVPLDGSFLKMSRGDYLIYNRHWLYEHFDMEMEIQRSAMKSMGYEPALKDAQPHWIPCSERLPACFEPVITWDGHCYSVEKRIPYIRDEDGKPIKSEWWVSDDYDELEETDCYPNLRDGAAIAWMPLPKPYEVNHE